MSFEKEKQWQEFLQNASRQELAEEIRRFASILSFHEILTSTFDLQEVLQQVLEKARKLSSANNASIFLINKKENVLEFAATTDELLGDYSALKVPLGHGISGAVALTGESINLVNAQQDARFYQGVDKSTGEVTESYLCVPLRFREEIIGTAQLMNKRNGVFTDSDERLMKAFATEAAIAIQTARLFGAYLEKQAIEKDIGLARSIQQRLLPSKMPALAGYSIHGETLPARSVGGDYFNFFPVKVNGRDFLDFAVADVSGKGIPAALIVSTVHTALQLLQRSEKDVASLGVALNRYLCANLPIGQFVTLIYCRLEPSTGKVEYLNCGHNLPFHFGSAREVEKLQHSGPILGVDPDAPYKSFEIRLEKHDLLILYSDGVVEAQNPSDELYQEERMLETAISAFQSVVKKAREEEAAFTITRLISRNVDEFRAGAENSDDTTFLILYRFQ